MAWDIDFHCIREIATVLICHPVEQKAPLQGIGPQGSHSSLQKLFLDAWNVWCLRGWDQITPQFDMWLTNSMLIRKYNLAASQKVIW